MKKAIILNHMFTGNFLNKNIGHEVINLFAADDCSNFIYLCKDGSFSRKDIDLEQSYVVQVQRPSKSVDTLEIISVASGLSLANNNFDANNPQPCYGGVKVSDIFAGNVQKQDRYLTFKAEKVYIPKRPIYIYHNKEGETVHGIHLKNYNPSQTMREYIFEGTPDYAALINGMFSDDNKELWTKRDECRSKVEGKSVDYLVTDIYGIQTRELSYSNALAFFINRYPKLFFDFCIDRQKDRRAECKRYVDVTVKDPLNVYREWNNIDLLVECGKYLFVIENKICSGINGIEYGKTQLDKYQGVIENAVEDEKSLFYKKIPVFIFLTPNHNDIQHSNEDWTNVYYGDIHAWLVNVVKNAPYNAERHLMDFVEALADQASTNLNERVMRRKFNNAIKSKKIE